MHIDRDQWSTIKTDLSWAHWNRISALIFTGAVLPIVESLLASLLVASTGTIAAVVLGLIIIIAVLHVILMVGIICGDGNGSAIQTINATELASELQGTQAELRRREIAYRSFRKAFAKLNNEVCRIQYDWCENGFSEELEPILAIIKSDIQTILGVCHPQWTLEVFCDFDAVEYCPKKETDLRPHIEPLELVYHASERNVTSDAIIELGSRSPAFVSRQHNIAMEKTLGELKELYLFDGKVRGDVYFRRWASVPIFVICQEESQGVLVLTTMQEEPLADDVLDSLEFIAAIVTQFISEFNQCLRSTDEQG
ncbi:MAG: hypothetical protein WDZ51_19410 [Pirellulaceae bacterium]